MAGFNVGALPYFIQYQGQLQEQARAQQDQQMRAQVFAQQQQQWQQQQQDRQRAQAAQTAAGNALPQLLAGGQVAAQPQGQMPPPPQPPAPGQASQPMQQPQGAAPLPGQGPAPGGVQPPLPPGGIPQGAQGQLPPFRPMPTTPPQSAAPQGAIPAPPAQAAATPANDQMEGGFSLSNIIQSGQKQGLSGSDLFDYVQTMEPYMTAQQKQKAEQFKTQLELKKLDAEIALHSQAAQNQQLSLQERARHDEALERLATQRIGIAEGSLDLRRGAAGGGGAAALPEPTGDPLNPKPTAGYSGEAIKALGEDYAIRGPSALSGFGNKNLPAAARTAIVNYAAAKNASTGQNFATNKVQYAADTAGARSNAVQAAKVDAAANALVQPGGIGDQFQEAVDALNRTGIPFANEAQMAILRKSNDPRVAAFDAAQNGVVSEAAQILGRGTLTVNSMEEARRVVNGWKTSEATKAGLAQLKREAATTVKASSEEVAKSARTPKGQPGATSDQGPVKISSDADYANLPSGAEFIAPDGSHRRKP